MRAVRLNAALPVGALNILDCISQGLIAVSDTEYRLLSLKLNISWTNVPNLAGAMMFGVAAPGLTAALIEEYLEATTSIDALDPVAKERANRKVRVLGIFPSNPTGSAGFEQVHMEGRPQTTKLNWLIPIGGQPQMWSYNMSVTNYPTGSELAMIGSANIKYN